MSKDLLLGTTKKNWGRRGASSGACGSLPPGATGYAPTKWWTQAQAEEKIQELMKSGGIFGMALPRDAAEKKAAEYLRRNLIGILS